MKTLASNKHFGLGIADRCQRVLKRKIKVGRKRNASSAISTIICGSNISH
jgi:hypothetical protein